MKRPLGAIQGTGSWLPKWPLHLVTKRRDSYASLATQGSFHIGESWVSKELCIGFAFLARWLLKQTPLLKKGQFHRELLWAGPSY